MITTIFQSIKNISLRTDLSFWSISVISATDILDILIVAFMIYKIIDWIKRTRAWSLFKGIIIILLVSMLSYFFNLYTVTWIVTNTFGVGLTALIILFQPEMRKALEQIGRGRTFSFFFGANRSGPKVSRLTVKELMDAAGEMSRLRTGALIVIENDYPLTDFEQTGIKLDALVSKQLLMNIFVDKTPLHDGAVIIRNNRITAATCILPLTQYEIGRDLGTRHRAAVGASEASDAFVLVVSEETGDMSVAIGGVLHRRLDERRIWDILYKESEVPEKKKRIGKKLRKP